MRFNLLLRAQTPHPVLPINYQYPVSAAIYKILAAADADYTAFLHDKGYQLHDSLKSFKLFTFSNLISPFNIKKDRLILKTDTARLTVAFHLPYAAEKFISGLFMNRQFDIADTKSRAPFTVEQIESVPFLPDTLSMDANRPVGFILRPVSPLIAGIKNAQGHYDFLPPDHSSFIYQLMYNWKEKYDTIYRDENVQTVFEQVEIKYLPEKQPFRSRLLTIKAGSPEETRIRGFERFSLQVSAPLKALELIGNAGMGLYNAMGMGCMEAQSIRSFAKRVNS